MEGIAELPRGLSPNSQWGFAVRGARLLLHLSSSGAKRTVVRSLREPGKRQKLRQSDSPAVPSFLPFPSLSPLHGVPFLGTARFGLLRSAAEDRQLAYLNQAPFGAKTRPPRLLAPAGSASPPSAAACAVMDSSRPGATSYGSENQNTAQEFALWAETYSPCS